MLWSANLALQQVDHHAQDFSILNPVDMPSTLTITNKTLLYDKHALGLRRETIEVVLRARLTPGVGI